MFREAKNVVSNYSNLQEDLASMISAQEALARLREGNRRFVSEIRSQVPLRARRVAASWQRARNRSPLSSDAPIRECQRRSSSIKALGICS